MKAERIRRVRVKASGDEVLVAVSGAGTLHPVGQSLAELLAAGSNALQSAADQALSSAPIAEGDTVPVAVLDRQEVWAAGVTYARSREARMDEAIAKDVYERVYEAPRPELFLKAPVGRIPDPADQIRVRDDSGWDVPEPELGLVLDGNGAIAGYLIGNDVSSRSIEGENPLYLPQAKMYDGALAISDSIVLAEAAGDSPCAAEIRLRIFRADEVLFDGTTSTSKMVRSFEDLAEHLFRELTHPYGAVLLTGASLVPPDEVTLLPGDRVDIEIAGLGKLSNVVAASRVEAHV